MEGANWRDADTMVAHVMPSLKGIFSRTPHIGEQRRRETRRNTCGDDVGVHGGDLDSVSGVPEEGDVDVLVVRDAEQVQ